MEEIGAGEELGGHIDDARRRTVAPSRRED
jgi:hypothetical protein